MLQHALALLTALGATPEATPATLELRWTGTPACVDGPTLLATLDKMVPAGVEGTLGVEASHHADGWHVGVDFADVQRQLVHADCTLLTEAVALIVAVRADPVASAVSVQTSAPVQRPAVRVGSARSSTPVPTATEPRLKDRPAESAPGRREREPASRGRPRTPLRPRWQGGLRAGVEVGTLPTAAGSVAAQVGARWRWVLVESGAAATLAPVFRSDAPGVEVDFSMFHGAVRGCYVFESRNVDIPLCAAVELGVLRAQPRELASPNDVNALWVAPGAGFRVQRWFARVAPMAFFEAATPVLRHRFEVEGAPVHALPPLVVRVGLGLRIGER